MEQVESITIPDVPTETEQEFKTTVSVASVYPAESPAGVFLESFALNLLELSDESIEVIVYHDSYMGEEIELEEQLQDGVIDFAILSQSSESPLYAITREQFVFDDDSIELLIELLREDDTLYHENHILTYINGGSIGLQTETRIESMARLLGLPTAAEQESEASEQRADALEPIPSTVFDGDYQHYYFADVQLSYELLTFVQAPQSGIAFADQQLVISAVEAAQIELSQWQEQNAGFQPDDLFIYVPADYENYIGSLPELSSRIDIEQWPEEILEIIEEN